jgi:hypothetical protein
VYLCSFSLSLSFSFQKVSMCRSIKQLRPPAGRAEPPATDAEIEAAALQYVRKVSGYRTPSRANQPAFEQAVARVAHATRELLAALEETDVHRNARVGDSPAPHPAVHPDRPG